MGFVIIIVIIVIIFWVIKGQGYDAARAKNSLISWATGDEGFCRECKHCIKDSENKYSSTGLYCTIGKCAYITDTTRMNCFEKPTVTENDLQELFSLGVWTNEGQQYIRSSILGKKMTFSEIDEFLKELPQKYPHYINPAFKKES